jgi:hypothetical protein
MRVQLGRAQHPVTVWFDGKKKSFDFNQEIFQKAFTGLDPLMIPEWLYLQGQL